MMKSNRSRLFDRHQTSRNLVQLLHQRSYHDIETTMRNRLLGSPELVHRLGLSGQLAGHQSSVNALEWSSSGRLIASGCEDGVLKLWDPFRQRPLTNVQSPHHGSLQALKFVPHSGDSHVATGCDNGIVMVHDVDQQRLQESLGGGGRAGRKSGATSNKPLFACRCHSGSVKSLAVVPDEPHMLWSACEQDGRVLQFDLREPHICNRTATNRIVLLGLDKVAGHRAVIKCMAINARRPEQLAIGANDAFVRLFDRRRLPAASTISSYRFKHSAPGAAAPAVRYFCPGQFYSVCNAFTTVRAVTSLAFGGALGNELLVNSSGEQLYLYDTLAPRLPVQLCALPERDTKPAAGGFSATSELPTRAQRLKTVGNRLLAGGHLLDAIVAYSKAIAAAPTHPVPYLNRAVALMRRDYFGDQYAALRDCQRAIRLDVGYVKAHYRSVAALLELGQLREAGAHLDWMCARWPDMRGHADVRGMRRQLAAADSAQCDGGKCSGDRELAAAELRMRKGALDWEERFVGHCNLAEEDVQQARFFGAEGQFVVAGSDDGNFYMWDRQTGQITTVCHADSEIVNCVQPHPYACLLATSGSDDVVRLWTPQPYSDDDTAYGPYKKNRTKQVPDETFIDWRKSVQANHERYDEANDENLRQMSAMFGMFGMAMDN